MTRFSHLLAAATMLATAAHAALAPLAFESPRGGEVYVQGQTQPIRLRARSTFKTIQIDLSRDGGATFTPLGTINNRVKVRNLRNMLAWKLDGEASGRCMFRATAKSARGSVSVSSAQFSIGMPVFAPTAGASSASSSGAVTNTLLAENSVDTTKIADGSVATSDLADGSVTTPKLAPLAVTDAKVSSGPASAGMILAADGLGGAAWTTNIATTVLDNAITSAKITDGVVQLSDLDTATVDARYVKKVGDTMTGTLKLPLAGPAAPEDAATKKYVDESLNSNKWSLTGNAGTDSATHFLGTTDNQALEIRVNGVRAMRIEPTGGAPNFIVGDSSNTGEGTIFGGTSNQVFGGTIGGGLLNRAQYSSFVGSGADNSALGLYSGVLSGWSNRADGQMAAICGGWFNYTYDEWCFVGGGSSNVAGVDDGDPSAQGFATVGGGSSNWASAQFATIGGGWQNSASGESATVAGGTGNRSNDSTGTVAGGRGNQAGIDDGDTTNQPDATVGGGNGNYAKGLGSTVSGGYWNTADGLFGVVSGGIVNSTGGPYSAVLGGSWNVASGESAAVPGGRNNLAAGIGSFAAGTQAKANHDGAFVWADNDLNAFDFPSTAANEFSARATGGVRFVTAIDGAGAPTKTFSIAPSGDTTVQGTLTATAALKVGSAAILSGTGSPEGAVTGNVGDLFLRTDGGAGTTLYVKESGAGTNTGWAGK